MAELWQKLKAVPDEIKVRFTSGLTMLYNFANAAIKIFFGSFSVLGPAFISGMFSLCVGTGKGIYFRGRKMCGYESAREAAYFRAMGVTLVFASAFFLAYMVAQLMSDMRPGRHGVLTCAVMVVVSLTELAFSVTGIAEARREFDILDEGLKFINLISSVNAVVTAETVVMALLFGHAGGVAAGGFFGLGLGMMSLAAGVYIIVRASHPLCGFRTIG